MKKNTILQQAFEEAAKREIEGLPAEDRIIRPYSEEFTEKMGNLINSKQTEKVHTRRKIKWPALIAAVLVTVILCTSFVYGKDANKIFTLFNVSGDQYFGIQYGNERFNVEEAINDDGVVELEYVGQNLEMTFYSETEENGFGCNYDILVYIDGIQQTFTAESGEDRIEDITRFPVTTESGESKKIKLTLQPNVGKKGEQKELFVVTQYDTKLEYTPQCNTPYKEITPLHNYNEELICVKCGKDMSNYNGSVPNPFFVTTMGHAIINMKKDAPEQIEVAESFSGMEVKPMHKLISKTYEYEDFEGNIHSDYNDSTMAGLRVDIYKDIEEHIYYDNGALCSANRINTKASLEDKFTFTFNGSTGKYRVSLYNGTELLTPFDGKAYTDIEVSYGNQTDLNVKLDTTKFAKGNNFVYALYENLDRSAENAGIDGQLFPATIVVE